MRGERARSRETPSEVDSVDAKTDDRTREKDESLPKPDVEMADAPANSTTTPTSAPTSKPEKDSSATENQVTTQPYPPVKPEEVGMDEDEDEDRLTQQDVIAKITALDRDVERLEARLLDLAARKAEHLSAIKQEEEREALAAAEQIPSAEESTEESNPTIKQEPTAALTPSMSPTSPTPTPSASSGSPASPTSSEADSMETESDVSYTASRKSAPADLPYLHFGPAPKLSVLEFFQANLEEHAGIKDSLILEISKHKKEVFEKGNRLKRKYKEFRGEWSQKCRDLDRDSRKKKGIYEPADAGVLPVQAATPGSEPVTRRRGGNVPVGDVVRSEAEMEQVMKDLAEQDAEKDAKAKLDGPKEAAVPDMILDVREKLLFCDTNRLLRTDEEILQVYRYRIPADDFNGEEQEKFCELYTQFPKQWHKISAGMGARDTKACIQHYYMTKKSVNYKELLNKGKRRRRRGRGCAPQKTRQSALLADLGKGKGTGGTGEDEDGDTEDITPAPITERGRPKRAAAPIFGQDPRNADNGSKGDEGEGNGNRRGGNKESKGDDDATEREKIAGTKRTRGGNNGGRGGNSKRVRTPAATPASSVPATPMPQPALAPIVEKKQAKVKEDLVQKESDAASALADLSSTPEIAPAPHTNIVMCTPEIQPQSAPRTATSTPKKDKDRLDRSMGPTTSSYWSVPEQTDFPHLLASFGTNWGLISQRLASKTTVMV